MVSFLTGEYGSFLTLFDNGGHAPGGLMLALSVLVSKVERLLDFIAVRFDANRPRIWDM